jgi:amino acid permease
VTHSLARSLTAGGALLAWVAAGLLVLTASLCYAELGAMLPSAGGTRSLTHSLTHTLTHALARPLVYTDLTYIHINRTCVCVCVCVCV